MTDDASFYWETFLNIAILQNRQDIFKNDTYRNKLITNDFEPVKEI